MDGTNIPALANEYWKTHGRNPKLQQVQDIGFIEILEKAGFPLRAFIEWQTSCNIPPITTPQTPVAAAITTLPPTVAKIGMPVNSIIPAAAGATTPSTNMVNDSDIAHKDGFNDDSYETLKAGIQNLGINKDYVRNWDSAHGFREFYQNWMDGMIESFNLTRDQVLISVIKDTSEEYTVVAKSSRSACSLGYICFQEKTGDIELTNFRAKLKRKALGFGVTSKQNLADVAGKHGEGSKVGALVLVRKGYQVRYESNSYYWNFSLEGPFSDTLQVQPNDRPGDR
ncbi:hypothetical protein HYALB_00008973 [Hymenoscyphus albidus]|uniref:Uncharacterized protein n=1 Tax=Hymenoscyphus albidus TaxID=595503 RepID=A0A9N9LQ62_9HELO|nr:hypothetical protein HYALB_00008973 [Hymenoscyphus albidus]